MPNVEERMAEFDQMREAAYCEIRKAFESWVNDKLSPFEPEQLSVITETYLAHLDHCYKDTNLRQICNPFALFAIIDYRWSLQLSQELPDTFEAFKAKQICTRDILSYLDSIQFLMKMNDEDSQDEKNRKNDDPVFIHDILLQNSEGFHSFLWESCLQFFVSDCNSLYLHIKEERIEQIDYELEGKCFREWDIDRCTMDRLQYVYGRLNDDITISIEVLERALITLVKLYDLNPKFVLEGSEALYCTVNINKPEALRILNFVWDGDNLFESFDVNYSSKRAILFLLNIYTGEWDISREEYYKILYWYNCRRDTNYIEQYFDFLTTDSRKHDPQILKSEAGKLISIFCSSKSREKSKDIIRAL